MAKARAWIATWNNPPLNGHEIISDLVQNEKVSFATGQLEKGELGTPHLQFYLEVNSNVRLSYMKKLIDPTIHWEPRRGTQSEVIAYVTKEDTRQSPPFEYGTKKEQGSRSDLLRAKEMIKSGSSELEVAEECFTTWAKFYKALDRYRVLVQPRRDWEMDIQVYWGEPGTGKTRKAFEDDPNAYFKPIGEWWDGYDGQETVIIDDFYGWLPYAFMLQLLDRYPLVVPTKGSFKPFNAKKIVITSNKHPEDWYDKTKCGFDALRRRITRITHFRAGLVGGGVPPPPPPSGGSRL